MIYLDRLLSNRLGAQLVLWDSRFGGYRGVVLLLSSYGAGEDTDVSLLAKIQEYLESPEDCERIHVEKVLEASKYFIYTKGDTVDWVIRRLDDMAYHALTGSPEPMDRNDPWPLPEEMYATYEHLQESIMTAVNGYRVTPFEVPSK